MAESKKPFDTILALNPRINKEEKKELEKNIFEKKQDGHKIDMCKFVRALIVKFNQDPDGTMEFLEINQK